MNSYAEFSVEVRRPRPGHSLHSLTPCQGGASIHLAGYFAPDYDEMRGGDDDDEEEEEEEEDEEGVELPDGRRLSRAQMLRLMQMQGLMGMDGGDEEGSDDEEFDEDEDEDEDEEEPPLGAPRSSGVRIRELREEEEAAAAEQASKKRPAASPAAPAPKGGAAAAPSPKGAAAAQQPPAKKVTIASPSPVPSAKPAAAAAAGAKPGSQFQDGPSGSLGSRVFDNGLEVINVKAGGPNGKTALPGKRVGVRYVGKLKSNNKVFDASKGNPFQFRLGVGEVIKGWDLGVKGMRVGDKRKLVIPPALGYGPRGAPPDIPGNAWLVFDVELVTVLD